MSIVKRITLLTTGIAALIMSSVASAEYFGLANGRLVDISKSPVQSVELGIMTGGDFVDMHYGGRFNYKVNDLTVVYGDLGQSELSGLSSGELSYGVGLFYQVKDVVSSADFAIHGSYHRSSADVIGYDVNLGSMILEGVFSGKEAINASGSLFWNASVGINRVSASERFSVSSTDLTFSVGVVMPQAATGELYASLFYRDDVSVAGGYRYFLN